MAERRLALVVATDRYDDPTLRGLAAPAADAEALAATLGDPALGEFEVDVLCNATSWVVAEHVDALLGERRPSDLVLVHFSCHGIKDDTGELYLAATNTRPDRLATTAVDAALVNRLMRRSRAQRVVLLLDCCYGGAFERGVVARGSDVHVGEQFAPSSLGGGRGRVVITASSAMEYAFEAGELTEGGSPRPSFFTQALVDGIRTGVADVDRDGWVSLDELYDHVHDTVTARTPNQTPSRWEFGVQGEMRIAHNPRGSQPAPSPLERVRRLAARAGGDDLAVAARAAEDLADLVHDDDRRVASAAQSALAAIAPRPDTSHLQLGAVTPGRTARAQVRITGSPLALASTVQTSGGVDAHLEHETLVVELSAQGPGPMAGKVTLHGPAGRASVDVAAEVLPVGPNLAVVAPLAVLGSAAIAAARWLPARHEGFLSHAPLHGTEFLLLLPALAAVVATLFLGWRKALPVVAGIWAGAAAWSGIFWAKRTMGGLAAVGLDGTIQGTFLTGHWGRLVGAVLLGGAVAICVAASPALRASVTRQRGAWVLFAGALVMAGALTPVAEIVSRGRSPVMLATEWLLVLALCLPIAALRLNPSQRRAALLAVVALCTFTIVRDVWVIATTTVTTPHFTVTVTAGVIVTAGCLLGQTSPHALMHPRTSHPAAPKPG